MATGNTSKVEDSCWESALRLLTSRSRSSFEVRKYLLRKGFEECVIAETLTRLQSCRLIDDMEFGSLWITARQNRKQVGRNYVAHELKQKGLPAEMIGHLLDQQMDMAKENQAAMEFACKRWSILKDLPNNLRWRRVSGSLQRRGFSWDCIESVRAKILPADGNKD